MRESARRRLDARDVEHAFRPPALGAGRHFGPEVLVKPEPGAVQLGRLDGAGKRLHRLPHRRQVLTQRLLDVGPRRASGSSLVAVQGAHALLALDHRHVAAEQVDYLARRRRMGLGLAVGRFLPLALVQPDRTRLDPGAGAGNRAAEGDGGVRVVAQALSDDRGLERQHRGAVHLDLCLLGHPNPHFRSVEQDVQGGAEFTSRNDGLGALILDWQLRLDRIAFRDASRFIDHHHEHLPGPTGWQCGQSIWNGPDLLGVVTVGQPLARAFDPHQVVEVTRLCVRRDQPAALRWNACSQLYGWAAREVQLRGFRRIITYTRQDEDGGTLRAVGTATGRPGAEAGTGAADRGSIARRPARDSAGHVSCPLHVRQAVRGSPQRRNRIGSASCRTA